MPLQRIPILAVLMLCTAIGCADGTLSVETETEPDPVAPSNQNGSSDTDPTPSPNEFSPSQDTGVSDDDTAPPQNDITNNTTNTTTPPPEDAGSPGPDAAPPPEDTEPPEDCCPVGEVECLSDITYRECVDDDGCGAWVEPLQCSSGHECDATIDAGDPCEAQPTCTPDTPEYGTSCTVGQGVCEATGTMHCADADTLECNATAGSPEPKQCNDRDSNCDGTVDSQGICGPCIDDGFAPDNHVSETAPLLNAGHSLDDVLLCDNEIASTSHNFFYLGQVASFEVTLEWEEVQGPLGLDFWTASTSQATWQDREFLADGGEDVSQLSHSQSLGVSQHIYARVFFRTNDKPPAGTPYTISHSN